MDIDNLIINAEADCKELFAKIDDICYLNQKKVLNAFRECAVSYRHFSQSTGYGYDDISRATLSRLFAKCFKAEDALVSPHFASGTHAITTVLFGLLRPKSRAVSISGVPYDTLKQVIFGSKENDFGSLSDFGIDFDTVPLINDRFDYAQIECALKQKCDMIYIQRSPGYTRRKAFSISELGEVIAFVRKFSNASIVIDNCYGEFTEEREPLEVGADIIVGSLIKNPGGSLAPTGGYVAGKGNLISKVAMRFTAPGIGSEIGSYEQSYRVFYQGLFLSPHIVAQARKGSALAAKALSTLGYTVFPDANDYAGDIVRVIDFDNKDKMIRFCRAIQEMSPIDSTAFLEPWDMPGYEDKIIMAAGTFVAGSSIELSADAPVKPPYSLYLQGGMTYEHTKIALKYCIESMICADK